jgi:hypothetical protein
MIACSSLVNEIIEKQARDSGFDLVIEAPLNISKIQSILDKIEC